MVKKKKINIWIVIGVIVLALFLLNKGTFDIRGLFNQTAQPMSIVGPCSAGCNSYYGPWESDLICDANQENVVQWRLYYYRVCISNTCYQDIDDDERVVMDCYPGECYRGACRYPTGCTDPTASEGDYVCWYGDVDYCDGIDWIKQDDCYDYSGYDSPCLRTVVRSSESDAMKDCTEVCNPDSSCASNTCIGNSCSDGCGGSVPGTKDCTPSCTTDWQCTDWSICSASIQTRTCTDSNTCGITDGKPVESKACEEFLLDFSVTGTGDLSGQVLTKYVEVTIVRT